MKSIIAKLLLILAFSGIIFEAQTSAAHIPEAVKHELRASRQGLREARSSTVENSTVEYSANWAGAGQVSPELPRPGTISINHVSAKWVVPTVSKTSINASGTWIVSSWVGIDGSGLTNCGSTAILQAGIDSRIIVLPNGTASSSVLSWVEWFPDEPIYFDNFTVAEGAVIEVSVTAENGTYGKVVLNNLSTGINETYIISGNAEENGTLCGGSAEWIVEYSEDWPEFLGDFSSVIFQDCKATTVTGSELSLSNSTLFSLVHTNTTSKKDVVELSAAIVNATEVQVFYVDGLIS